MKKLPRVPMRPEREPGVEVPIWQPGWNCFCCHDTGIIMPHLASEIIEGYDPKQDKLPLCVKPGCQAASLYDEESLSASIDRRIKSATCQQLDELEREAWRETVKVKMQQIQRANKRLAAQKNLRLRDRTSDEEYFSQERHRLVVEEDWGVKGQGRSQDIFS